MRKSNHTRKWLGVAASAVALTLGAAALLRECGEWMQVDSCLDRGGCWDANHERCEMQDQSRCDLKPLP